jgi:hypothetical protein
MLTGRSFLGAFGRLCTESVTDEEDARDVVRRVGKGCLELDGPCSKFENHNNIFVVQNCCLVIPDAQIKDEAIFQLTRNLKPLHHRVLEVRESHD